MYVSIHVTVAPACPTIGDMTETMLVSGKCNSPQDSKHKYKQFVTSSLNYDG